MCVCASSPSAPPPPPLELASGRAAKRGARPGECTLRAPAPAVDPRLDLASCPPPPPRTTAGPRRRHPTSLRGVARPAGHAARAYVPMAVACTGASRGCGEREESGSRFASPPVAAGLSAPAWLSQAALTPRTHTHTPSQEVVAGDDADEGTDVSSDEEGEEEGELEKKEEMGRGAGGRGGGARPNLLTCLPLPTARSGEGRTRTRAHAPPPARLLHTHPPIPPPLSLPFPPHPPPPQPAAGASSPGARRRRARRSPSWA